MGEEDASPVVPLAPAGNLRLLATLNLLRPHHPCSHFRKWQRALFRPHGRRCGDSAAFWCQVPSLLGIGGKGADVLVADVDGAAMAPGKRSGSGGGG